jgi:hypothetical protein
MSYPAALDGSGGRRIGGGVREAARAPLMKTLPGYGTSLGIGRGEIEEMDWEGDEFSGVGHRSFQPARWLRRCGLPLWGWGSEGDGSSRKKTLRARTTRVRAREEKTPPPAPACTLRRIRVRR